MLKSKLRSVGRRIFPYVDRVILSTARLFGDRRGGAHILITAPGNGNIGDQAMFDAFVQNVPGRITAVMTHVDALQNADPGRVEVVAMPALMQLAGPRHWRDVWRLGRLARTADSFSVTGADIMDGGYNPVASVSRWNLALSFAGLGISARILGFSWNGRPPAIVRHFAQAAHDAGVRLLLRDPVSLRRIQADGLTKAIGTSDTVFRLSGEKADFDGSEDVAKLAPGGFVIVNASALVARALDQAGELREVIDAVIASGRNVIVLPHVQRGAHGDIEEGQRLVTGYPADRVVLIDRLLEPSAIRSLAKSADVVVTGRMHLAIMSLSQGTPALVVSTQGKVEGLAELFASPDLLLEPNVGVGSIVVERIGSDRVEAYRRVIAERLPSVTELAGLNFEGFSGRE